MEEITTQFHVRREQIQVVLELARRMRRSLTGQRILRRKTATEKNRGIQTTAGRRITTGCCGLPLSGSALLPGTVLMAGPPGCGEWAGSSSATWVPGPRNAAVHDAVSVA